MAETTNASAPAAPYAATAQKLQPHTVPEEKTGLFGGIKRFFGFIGWLLTGFGLLGAIRKHQRGKADEIIVYTVHQSFYLWMIILVGFIAGLCVKHWPGTA